MNYIYFKLYARDLNDKHFEKFTKHYLHIKVYFANN
jgi:hypothetical protein